MQQLDEDIKTKNLKTHAEESEENALLANMLEDDDTGSDDHDSDQELVKPDYAKEIIEIIRGNYTPRAVKDKLESYHENDIAEVLEQLEVSERRKLYRILETDMLSAVFEYAESDAVSVYLSEMDLTKAAKILSQMDTDVAVEILREIQRDRRILLIELLDDEKKEDIALIASFDEDEIGSKMSTNFIVINDKLSVKEAMAELIEQAEKNDNISTIFVVDENGVFCGAIDLKELIIARNSTPLDDIVITSFPYVYGTESVDDCIERLRDYSENSIPVLDNNNRILGVITSQSIVEVIGDELTEDYVKFAGLTSEVDLNESLWTSLGKRLPWLFVLLGLGLVISSVVGIFENAVVQHLSIVMAFQSLILDMAGNSGTQSLAVTIRVLTDENLDFKKKRKLFFKETRIGLMNGLIIGSLSFGALGLYMMLFRHLPWNAAFGVSGCAGIALVTAMFIASGIGTLVPLIFKKLKIDPAVASGPLITSMNDLIAVVTYYGLCWILLLNVMKLPEILANLPS